MPREIPRTLIIGTGVTILALVLIYVFTQLPSGGEKVAGTTATADQASYGGSDKCAGCQRRVTPDIVNQYAHSTMAKSGVKCVDCHVVDRSNPMGKDHEGFFVANKPTPKQCARCHPGEHQQYEQ